MNQQIWQGKPPAPVDDIERYEVTVDLLAGSDMRGLWVYVNRYGLTKPHIEQARKQIGMTTEELADAIRTFLQKSSHQLRRTDGAQLLDDWYAKTALFSREAAK